MFLLFYVLSTQYVSCFLNSRKNRVVELDESRMKKIQQEFKQKQKVIFYITNQQVAIECIFCMLILMSLFRVLNQKQYAEFLWILEQAHKESTPVGHGLWNLMGKHQ